MRTTLIIAALALMAVAEDIPAQDALVPEDAINAASDDLVEARATLSSLKAAGKSDVECRKLVTDTTTDITTTVTTEQKIIDEIPDGSQCTIYHKSTESLKTAKKEADAHLKITITNEKVAHNAKVDFGSRTFSSLTEGECDTFFDSDTYTTAKTTYDTTVTKRRQAEGAAAEATSTLTKAITKATEDTRKCLCKTRSDQEAAWNKALQSVTSNQNAWAKAHKLECVLDSKTTCRIPPLPQLKRPTVTDDVKEASCASTKKAVVETKAPEDPCKKWAEEKKADEQLAKDLEGEVSFEPNKADIKSSGKKTLDTVATTLMKYPWMTINVQAHSDAKQGEYCLELTKKRAAAAEDYLKSKGVTNKMTAPTGKCATKRAIVVKGAGEKAPPKGCKAAVETLIDSDSDAESLAHASAKFGWFSRRRAAKPTPPKPKPMDGGRKRPIRMDGGRKRPTPPKPKPMDGGRKRPIRMDGGRKRPTPPKPMDGGRKMPVVRKPIKHRIVGGACKPCKKGTFRGEFDELLQDGACPPCRPMKELKPIKRKIVKRKPVVAVKHPLLHRL
jgi:outer membrane protein OmpA-like peptidoglycan-associated protein